MRPLHALLSLHAAVALFGVAGLFGAWIALSPVTIVLGRTTIATLALAALAAALGDARRPERGLAMNGAVLAFHWVAFFAAIQVAGVAVGLIGFASFPLWTLVLERASGERRVSPGDGVVALLVVTGLVLTVPRFDWRDEVVRGLAWGIASGATFAWLAVRNRGYARRRPARSIALWQNAFAALFLVPVALWWPGAGRWPSPHELGLLLVLGIGCTALAHTLFVASLSAVTAHTASVVAALEPVYGIALAAWLLGERPTAGMLAGCALLVAAAIVASRAAARPPDGANGKMRG
jgi:drug/metabolite transporter (DMT)-like permease